MRLQKLKLRSCGLLPSPWVSVPRRLLPSAFHSMAVRANKASAAKFWEQQPEQTWAKTLLRIYCIHIL